MNLIIDKAIFLKYLSNIGPRSKTQNIALLITIFEHQENKILLSRGIIERLENEINSDPKMLYSFQAFIKDVSDSNRYETLNTSTEEEQEEIIEIFEMANKEESKFVLIGEYKAFYEKNPKFINHACFYDTINKPNKCWLIFNLLANRTISVRYNDFKSNIAIEHFFLTFFKLPITFEKIIIIDSYCNVRNHKLFLPLAKKGFPIHVHTSASNKVGSEIDLLRGELKEYFGKKNTHIKFSTDKKILHERTIALSEFVLESNHDFAEIKRENRNWKVDITISSPLHAEIIDRCQYYN
jgi:hypothetical protein